MLKEKEKFEERIGIDKTDQMFNDYRRLGEAATKKKWCDDLADAAGVEYDEKTKTWVEI